MALHIAIDCRRLKDFGIGTYIRNLVRALSEIDPEDTFTLIARRSDARDLENLPDNFRVAVHDRDDRDGMDQVAFPWLVRRLSPDVCHVPNLAAPVFMPRPYVVTVHDMSSLIYERREGVRQGISAARLRRGLLRASRVIAVSTATQRDVVDLLNIPPQQVLRIYNAIDPRFAAPAASGARGAAAESEAMERRRVLERYQISYPFLLYAGTIRPQKNISRLVEAFAVLRGDLENHPQYRDLRLIIIGDEISRYPDVRRAVIQTHAEQSVRFLGFVPIDTLRVFYAAAEAFVFPSLYEGFGLPPLEAMAAGTPVVTSGVSSLPEVVGDAAMIVNPENVFDIARGMREVLFDENLRGQLIAKGFEQLKMFSWERTARDVLAVYREVAG